MPPEPARRGNQTPPRVLLLAMYRLDEGRSGPTIRIGQMREALARRVQLDLLSGTRLTRARGILGYLLGGRFRGVAGIYVESSTTLPGPADLLLLAIARARRMPVVTYIRDAYQLFPEYYPVTSLRRRISRAAFLPVTRWLAGLSTVTAFPSRGLARVVLGDSDRAVAAALIPPGSRIAEAPPVDPSARAFLYVGALAHDASGGDLLVEAMTIAAAGDPRLRLICVVPGGQGPREPVPRWLDVVRASGPEIERILPDVLATIIPRPRSAYNDLAVPIKLLEYLGYGRPLVVTDAIETAAIVRAAGAGIVVRDTAASLAGGIAAVAEAPPEQILQWGVAARRTAEANSWDSRATAVLALLGIAD